MGVCAMVRGVNKKVVEVVDLDHEYFERAILFVRELQGDREEPMLRQEAGKYIRGLRYRPGRKGMRLRWGLGLLKLGGAAAMGAGLMHLLSP